MIKYLQCLHVQSQTNVAREQPIKQTRTYTNTRLFHASDHGSGMASICSPRQQYVCRCCHRRATNVQMPWERQSARSSTDRWKSKYNFQIVDRPDTKHVKKAKGSLNCRVRSLTRQLTRQITLSLDRWLARKCQGPRSYR